MTTISKTNSAAPKGCAPLTGSPATTPEQEIDALTNAIEMAEKEIRRLENQVRDMRDKQCRRRQELGKQLAEQRARAAKPRQRVYDTPQPGTREVIVQTDCGLTVRYVRYEENAPAMASADDKTPPKETTL